MRCLTLAKELKKRNCEIIFICKEQKGDLINLIENYFYVIRLKKRSIEVKIKDQNIINHEHLLYQEWLGWSQQSDTKFCINELRRNEIKDIDWIITDHYSLDYLWEEIMYEEVKKLRSLDTYNVCKILVIDDLANRKHVSNLILDQNYFGSQSSERYRNHIQPEKTELLLGPSYALIGEEYSKLHSLLPERSKVNRILIFMGGVDKFNITGKAIEALMKNEFSSIWVDVVIGRQTDQTEKIKSLAKERKNTTLHYQIKSLSGLMYKADLSIGGAGVTTWERCCLGLNSLVITIANNQIPIANALHKEGYIQYIGSAEEITSKKIEKEINKYIKSKDKKKSGHNLVDGLGAKRVANIILGPRLYTN